MDFGYRLNAIGTVMLCTAPNIVLLGVCLNSCRYCHKMGSGLTGGDALCGRVCARERERGP